MPCAAGRIPSPIVTDSNGAFDIEGFFAPQVGPVSIDGPAWQPARFVATRNGDELTLTIVRASADSIGSGSFTAARRASSRAACNSTIAYPRRLPRAPHTA